MGIQCTVELKDIPCGWTASTKMVLRQDRRCDIHTGWCDWCHNNGCYVNHPILLVEIPGIGVVESYMGECLMFDCKTANQDILAAVKDANIPHRIT